MNQTELRAWLSQKIIPVKGTLRDKFKTAHPSRLTTRTIARHLKTDHGNLWNAIRGNRKFGKDLQRELINFINEWENGEWELTIQKRVKILVKREIPRKTATFRVNLGNLSLSKAEFFPKRDVMPSKLWRE